MRVDHLALWCDDIEAMRSFYTKYFVCESNAKYYNPIKMYTSYFLSFGGGDCRIELMNRPNIIAGQPERGFVKGFAHMAIEVGGEDVVDDLVKKLRLDGYTIASEPRRTGDGYYEAAVLDPEGNYVELSAVK